MDIVGERVFSLSLSGYVELWGPQRKKQEKKVAIFQDLGEKLFSSLGYSKQMKDLGIWKSDGQTCGHVFCTEGRLNLA